MIGARRARHRGTQLRATIAAALLAVVTLALPHVASADAEAARFHDTRARRHYRAGRYENAIAEFFLAQRNAPNAGTLLNIAVCFQLLHRWDEAYLHYTEYLERAEPDDERRARAEEALTEIEPHVARVHVVTEPPGATIYVDTRERGSYGVAPRLLAVPAGERRVEVELEGHRPATATVEAIVGAEATVTIRLVPVTGTLSVDADIAAEVAVRNADGELAASGPTPLEVALPPGPYVAEISADGYVSRRELVSIEADERLARAVRLEPTPVATGELTVTSNVSGAVVSVDGSPAGFTPLALTEVPTGPRTVRVDGDGLEPWSGRVSVAEADRAWLTVNLQPQRTATHSDATWAVGGAGLGALAVAGLFAGLAAEWNARFFAELGTTNVLELRDQGIAFGVVADAGFALGGAALLVGLIVFIAEETSGRPRTSGTVTRRPR